MNLIKTTIVRRRMKYGALRKNSVQETKSDAYLCPRCHKLVSYIPVLSIKRCVYCNQDLDWSVPEKTAKKKSTASGTSRTTKKSKSSSSKKTAKTPQPAL